MGKSEEQYTPIFYNTGEMDKPASELIADLRAQLAKIRGKFHDIKEKYGHKDYLDFMQGCLTSAIISASHSEKHFVEFENRMNSHSPDNGEVLHFEYRDGKQVDTLQEGDWFQGTEEQYRKVFELSGRNLSELAAYNAVGRGYVSLMEDGHGRSMITFGVKLTQLTPEEFLRRAENTFNNK